MIFYLVLKAATLSVKKVTNFEKIGQFWSVIKKVGTYYLKKVQNLDISVRLLT